MKTKVETHKAPSAGTSPHSQAIVANRFVFTRGSIYLTPEGKLLDGNLEDQIHQIMKNLEAILAAAGVIFADVVKSPVGRESRN